MEAKGFRKAGHAPSLFSAFLYFDVSFMIWVLCGALSLYITKDLDYRILKKRLWSPSLSSAARFSGFRWAYWLTALVVKKRA